MNIASALAEVVGAEQVGVHPALGKLPVARPREEAECVELLRLAARDSLKVRLLGAGSKLCWTRPARDADFAVGTRQLTGIVDFEAGDGTLTARAGSSVAELNETIRAAGLEITPDVPRPAAATLGGVIAAGQSGPDRLRHGPSRMHLLGTRTLLANGEITRSGGRLVKNATGYDLHRLYCGSHGSLGLILDASLRLVSSPEATVVMSESFRELDAALSTAAELRGLKVEPRALTIENRLSDGSWGLHAVLAGRGAQLEVEVQRLAKLLGASEPLDGDAGRARAECLRDLEPDAREGPVLHLAVRPSQLKRASELLFELLGGEPGGAAVLQPGVATVDLHAGPELGEPARLRAAVHQAREVLAPLGARLAVRGQFDDQVPLDRPSPAEALERRVRVALDPHATFVGGREPGGR